MILRPVTPVESSPVLRGNQRAQAFYRKSGFVDVGAQTFAVGLDEQTDRVMALTLTTP